MQLSHWEESHLTRQRNVLIIGAGIVGLNTAIRLKESKPEWHITIIDKSTYGCPASTRNAGFACFGTVSEILSDREVYGDDGILNLISMRRRGLERLLSKYRAQRLEFVQCGGYEVFVDRAAADPYLNRIDEVNELMGENLFYTKKKNKDHRVYELMAANDQEAYLNTAMLYQTLLMDAQQRGVEIIKGIEALSINSNRVSIQIHNEKLEMKADQIVAATNALTSRLLTTVDVHPVRNQVLITKPIQNHGLYGTYHMDSGYVYFRDMGDQILIGGARNHFSTEDTAEFGINRDNQLHLVNFLKHYFLPDSYSDTASGELIQRSWSGILTGGTDRLPIVKRIDETTIVAARLGGMGVAIGAEIGQRAADLVLDD